MLNRLPKHVQRAIEQVLINAILTTVESLLNATPEKREKALDDLRYQARTGKIREDALLSVKL